MVYMLYVYTPSLTEFDSLLKTGEKKTDEELYLHDIWKRNSKVLSQHDSYLPLYSSTWSHWEKICAKNF